MTGWVGCVGVWVGTGDAVSLEAGEVGLQCVFTPVKSNVYR